MRTWTISLSILMLAIIVPGGSCPAAILNVPADQPDIATALATAIVGDEVVIAAGTYQEHDLVLPSGAVLCGATGNPGVGAGGLSLALSSHVVLENCEIMDNSAGSFLGGVSLDSGAVLEAFEATILNNSATLGANGDVGSSASATLTCCVVDISGWSAGLPPAS